MRLNFELITALILLSLTGCAGCGAVPIAKPWNNANFVPQDDPCNNPSAKQMAEDHCSPKEENPIY